MKKNATIKFMFLILVSVFFNTVTRGQIASYAAVPYYTGFESNVLDANWYTAMSAPGGRVRIWQSDTLIWGGDTAQAHSGNYWLGLDNLTTAGTYIQKEAWMGLDVAGQSGLRFRFWWTDWDDEPETQDGIFISTDGGANFIKAVDLNGDSSSDLTWNYFDLNLDSINIAHGISYTSTYVIKFQEYDDYYFAGGNDGFMFDDIYVGPAITGINQHEADAFRLYPNPANGTVYLSGLNLSSDVHIKVKNILGEEVPSSIMNEHNNFKIEWTGNPGIYFIEVNDGEVSQMLKVIKN
jgi:hypothetical protein